MSPQQINPVMAPYARRHDSLDYFLGMSPQQISPVMAPYETFSCQQFSMQPHQYEIVPQLAIQVQKAQEEKVYHFESSEPN